MSKKDDVVDVLVPDPAVRREFGGISEDTLKAWDEDPDLGFVPKIVIRNRNYRSRAALDAFKDKLAMDALAAKRKRRRA